jgi:hypothetical protein
MQWAEITMTAYAKKQKTENKKKEPENDLSYYHFTAGMSHPLIDRFSSEEAPPSLPRYREKNREQSRFTGPQPR